MKKVKSALCPLLFIMLLAACCFAMPDAALCAEQGPADVVKDFHDVLLESMKKGAQLGYQGRYALIEPVFKKSFAQQLIVEKSMGRYWQTLKDPEKALLEKKYTEWSIAQYAHNFDSFSGEQFAVMSENVQPDGTAVVADKLTVPSDNKDVIFYYKLRKIQNAWRIVDIQIEGVSQLAQTRSQFVYIMKDKGFDGLIKTVQEKITAFSQK